MSDNVIEFPFAKETVEIAGNTFTFRELTVAENDACADAAQGPDGNFNGRTMMRMMIIESSVEPKLTTEDLAKMPNRVYIKIYDVVNRLNTLDIDDSEGNA